MPRLQVFRFVSFSAFVVSVTLNVMQGFEVKTLSDANSSIIEDMTNQKRNYEEIEEEFNSDMLSLQCVYDEERLKRIKAEDRISILEKQLNDILAERSDM